MNPRIQKLVAKSGGDFMRRIDYNNGKDIVDAGVNFDEHHKFEKFVQLIVQDVLKQVETRAYYSGDRAWSDELDRPWIELEYGFGELADAQGQAGKKK
jgi:hypothetical protein